MGEREDAQERLDKVPAPMLASMLRVGAQTAGENAALDVLLGIGHGYYAREDLRRFYQVAPTALGWDAATVDWTALAEQGIASGGEKAMLRLAALIVRVTDEADELLVSLDRANRRVAVRALRQMTQGFHW